MYYFPFLIEYRLGLSHLFHHFSIEKMANQLKKDREIISNYSEAQIQNILHQVFHFYMPFTNLV